MTFTCWVLGATCLKDYCDPFLLMIGNTKGNLERKASSNVLIKSATLEYLPLVYNKCLAPDISSATASMVFPRRIDLK